MLDLDKPKPNLSLTLSKTGPGAHRVRLLGGVADLSILVGGGDLDVLALEDGLQLPLALARAMLC